MKRTAQTLIVVLATIMGAITVSMYSETKTPYESLLLAEPENNTIQQQQYLSQPVTDGWIPPEQIGIQQ